MPSLSQKIEDTNTDQGQLSSKNDYADSPKLDSNVQLNLENLTKIDEKL